MKKLILSLAFVFAVVGFSPVAFADQPVDVGPPGNNGTLKVHEKGTPSGTESNDPKVCVFNFEGFDLDANQTGNITVEGHGATPSGEYLVVELSTNAGGDGETAYINDGGSLTLANGHYKATLDNKFGTDPGDKAKSKVFKVTCDEPGNPENPEEPEEPETPVTPGNPVTPSDIDVDEEEAAQVEAPVAGVNAGSGDAATIATAVVTLVGSLASLAYGVVRFTKFGA